MIEPFDNPLNQPINDKNKEISNQPLRDDFFAVEDFFGTSPANEYAETFESFFGEGITIPKYRRVTWFQQATRRLMIVVFVLSMGCVGFVAYHAKNSFEQNLPSFQAFLSWLLLR